MDPRTISETQQWRRCSLAALAVLLLSIAGEQVLTAMDPVPSHPRKSCTYRFPYAPTTKAFRAVTGFLEVPAR